MERGAWQVTVHGVTESDDDCSLENKRHLLTPWEENYDQPRQHINKQRHYYVSTVPFPHSVQLI